MITIDYRDKRPIYEQIIDAVETMAAQNLYPADAKLPSVRQLAMELSINPNTIQRAYMDLEQRGVIYALPGRGNFISGDLEKIRAQSRKTIFDALCELAAKAVRVGLTEKDLTDMVRAYFEQTKGDDKK